jgi:hypothetical protein
MPPASAKRVVAGGAQCCFCQRLSLPLGPMSTGLLKASIRSALASRIVEPERKPDDKEKPDPAKTVEEKE